MRLAAIQWGMSGGHGLGVALGGGTARGLAHIGALQVLEERGWAVDALAGTSYGAIMAALYALGMPGLELERLVRHQNTGEIWAQGVDFGLHRGALIHGRRLGRWLDRKFFQGATFADCRIPLAIATTDLATGELHVLREGSIAAAVQASCALPFVFAPVELGGRIVVDGGLAEPVPFRTVAALGARRVLGVHAGIDARASKAIAWFRALHRTPGGRAWERYADGLGVGSSWSRLARGASLSLRAYEGGIRVPDGATLVEVSPPIAWWDFHRSPEAVRAGRHAMERALDGLAATPRPVVPMDG
jgi:NTE family protein